MLRPLAKLRPLRIGTTLIALLLVACAAEQPSGQSAQPPTGPASLATTAPAPPTTTTAAPSAPSSAATAPAAPTEAAGDTPRAADRLTPPSGLPTAPVVRVIDGDTLDVRLAGKVVRLRLIGIDTPEVVDPRRPVECFGREASAKAHELLDGQTVALEADPSQDDVDRYGRLLRYIWLPDGRLFNLELIAQGYAFEYTYNLPYTYRASFQEAQRAAREQQRGLWAPAACVGEHRPATTPPTSSAAPAPAPATAPAPPAAAGNCDPSYPGVCIPPPPPDLDCGDIPYKRFQVLPPDPHHFDGDRDGIGCER